MKQSTFTNINTCKFYASSREIDANLLLFQIGIIYLVIEMVSSQLN